MWVRTLAGLLIGLILNTSLMLNIAHLLPISRQMYFLITFIGGFCLWAGIATVFYCAHGVKKPLLYCLGILIPSLGINGLFLLEIVG